MTIAVLACHKAETPAARGTAAPQTPQRTKAPSPSTSSQATTSSAAEATGAPTNVGDPMPSYQAKLLDGSPYDLASEKGHVILLNVWATWCPPCRKEMPDLQALYDKYKDQGFVVLAISDEEMAKVAPFIGQRGISYPVLLDPGRKVNEEFMVEGIPKSFVYDREGKLVAQSIDMRTRGQFQQMLAQAGLQ